MARLASFIGQFAKNCIIVDSVNNILIGIGTYYDDFNRVNYGCISKFNLNTYKYIGPTGSESFDSNYGKVIYFNNSISSRVSVNGTVYSGTWYGQSVCNIDNNIIYLFSGYGTRYNSSSYNFSYYSTDEINCYDISNNVRTLKSSVVNYYNYLPTTTKWTDPNTNISYCLLFCGVNTSQGTTTITYTTTSTTYVLQIYDYNSDIMTTKYYNGKLGQTSPKYHRIKNNKLYIYGGTEVTSSGSTVKNEIYIYDILNNTWTTDSNTCESLNGDYFKTYNSAKIGNIYYQVIPNEGLYSIDFDTLTRTLICNTNDLYKYTNVVIDDNKYINNIDTEHDYNSLLNSVLYTTTTNGSNSRDNPYIYADGNNIHFIGYLNYKLYGYYILHIGDKQYVHNYDANVACYPYLKASSVSKDKLSINTSSSIKNITKSTSNVDVVSLNGFSSSYSDINSIIKIYKPDYSGEEQEAWKVSNGVWTLIGNSGENSQVDTFKGRLLKIRTITNTNSVDDTYELFGVNIFVTDIGNRQYFYLNSGGGSGTILYIKADIIAGFDDTHTWDNTYVSELLNNIKIETPLLLYNVGVANTLNNIKYISFYVRHYVGTTSSSYYSVGYVPIEVYV